MHALCLLYFSEHCISSRVFNAVFLTLFLLRVLVKINLESMSSPL